MGVASTHFYPLKDDKSSVAYPSITTAITRFSAPELLAQTILDGKKHVCYVLYYTAADRG